MELAARLGGEWEWAVHAEIEGLREIKEISNG
jgi:hypothetical protein